MKVCIVGGGGGASNAANVIRRLDSEAQIDIFTMRDYIGTQPCEIPFVLEGFLPTWEDTYVFRERFYKERNINVHLATEVTEIIRTEKRIIAGGESYGYEKLILDMGALPQVPSIPGVDGKNEFVLSTSVQDGKILEEAIPGCSSAAIIGVGQVALDVASVLKEKDYEKVFLIGRSDRILRAYLDKDMAERIESRVSEMGIEVMLSAKINSIAGRSGKKVISLPGRELEVDFIFFGTGSVPNVELARKAGITIGESGAVAVNEYLQTSDPDIYAIGDCMENQDRIIGRKITYQTATSGATTGRLAARNLVLGNVVPYPGTALSFVTEIFGYQVGTVGFTESYAREQGLDVVSGMLSTATRRRAFGGKPIHIKLVADRKSRTLVGAQIISEEMVAGKIDRLAVVIGEKVPVQRLALTDTCYSPTVGSAYESIVMALDELIPALD
jgi:NADH oxidase (H2O2-forming)